MDLTRNDLIHLARCVISICKEEVEASIGPNLIEQVDDGSPWGRTFLRVCKDIDDPTKGWIDPDDPSNSAERVEL